MEKSIPASGAVRFRTQPRPAPDMPPDVRLSPGLPVPPGRLPREGGRGRGRRPLQQRDAITICQEQKSRAAVIKNSFAGRAGLTRTQPLEICVKRCLSTSASARINNLGIFKIPNKLKKRGGNRDVFWSGVRLYSRHIVILVFVVRTLWQGRRSVGGLVCRAGDGVGALDGAN